MKTEIETYAKEIQTAYDNDPFWGKNKDKHIVTVEYGRKFAKVFMTSWGSKSIHCFVEIANGNIHKSTSYHAPQKNGLRGNVTNQKKPIFSSDFYVR